MDRNSKIKKKNVGNLCFQAQGDKLIILSADTSKLLTLNATSQFLYQNCNDKSVGCVALELYEACKEFTDISYEQVLGDSIVAFAEMEKNGLIDIN